MAKQDVIHRKQILSYFRSVLMVVINYKLIPKMLNSSSRGVKTASRNTINDLAFIARKEITQQANSDMSISGNVNNALGFRVNKAVYGRMVAEVYTTRGWLYYHLNKGERRAKSGFIWKGVSWLIMPIMDKAFTRRGRLKKSIARRVIVIKPKGGNPLLLHRLKRGKGLGIIARLTPQAKYHEDTHPENVIRKVMKKYGKRILLSELQKYGAR